MKLVDMKCPNCGSDLKFDIVAKECTCEYCGAKLLIDGETVHVKYDNAEEAGYQFEKGRQRAQKEATYTERINPDHSMPQKQSKKKSRIWLWILGWICIFPLPLTILMLRKKNMKLAIKYGIIAVAWIIYILIGFSGANQNQTKSTSKNSTEITNTYHNVAENIEDKTKASEAIPEEKFYAGDDVVNYFIADYNSKEEIKITNIEKGNIRQKAYAYIGDVYIEMLDSYGAYAENYNMSIYGGNTAEATDDMFDVFRKVAKVLEPNLTENQIDEAVSSWRSSDVLVEDGTLGELTITYVPSKELSTGRNDSRIDVSSPVYGKPN